MKNLVLFASGNGSNVKAIIDYFINHKNVTISLIVTNNPQAGVIGKADQYKIPTLVINDSILKSNDFIATIKSYNPDLIVLAGFLRKIPKNFIGEFNMRIINIHPALLPKYGGKGMYGTHIHKAVIESEEKESGITIHYVNEFYDEGTFIMQANYLISTTETIDTLARNVQKLEHFYYPRTIEYLLFYKNKIS